MATADFDLRGHVGIRVVGATAADIATVERQLGPLRGRLDREPDITVRFVESLTLHGPVRLLGDGEYAHTDDQFLILRQRYRAHGRIAMPMADVGGRCEIVCESGIPAVPLLMAVVTLTALSNGVASIHGSAFVSEGRGILVSGWAKGGKTETLLAFMARGARYVGDEWVFVAEDGTMFGVPEPIRFWAWHLAQRTELRRRVPLSTRGRVMAVHAVGGLADSLARRLTRPRLAARLLPRLAPVIVRQAAVQVPPVQAFGPRRLVDRHRLDALVLAVSHEDATYVSQPITAAEVVGRLSASARFEWLPLQAAYLAHLFAFPDRRNRLLDELATRHAASVARALTGLPTFRLGHPYPPRIARLHDVLAPRLHETFDAEALPPEPPHAPLARVGPW
jgi:hypothetical protein